MAALSFEHGMCIRMIVAALSSQHRICIYIMVALSPEHRLCILTVVVILSAQHRLCIIIVGGTEHRAQAVHPQSRRGTQLRAQHMHHRGWHSAESIGCVYSQKTLYIDRSEMHLHQWGGLSKAFHFGDVAFGQRVEGRYCALHRWQRLVEILLRIRLWRERERERERERGRERERERERKRERGGERERERKREREKEGGRERERRERDSERPDNASSESFCASVCGMEYSRVCCISSTVFLR